MSKRKKKNKPKKTPKQALEKKTLKRQTLERQTLERQTLEKQALEDLEKKMLSKYNEPSTFVSGFNFLALIAGGMAAISAVLAALGFFVVSAYTERLGIINITEYSTTEYIYEGAKFLYATINSSVADVGAYLALTIFSLFFILKVSEYLPEDKNFIKNLKRSKDDIALGIVFLAIFISFSFTLIYYATHYVFPSQNNGILFINDNQERIISKDEVFYYHFVLYFIVVMFAFSVSLVKRDKVVRKGIVMKNLGNHPFEYLYGALRVVACIMFLILISVWATYYGRSLYPRNFQEIQDINTNNEILREKVTDGAWLIKENTDSFVIYFSELSTVEWVSKKDISSLKIGKNIDLSKIH